MNAAVPSPGRTGVAISITTHNRREDLARTLQRLQGLRPLPAEVIVCADGCRDDTVAYVRSQHPEVLLIEHPTGQGSVASRDEIIRRATAPIVLSLDDDSYPVEDDFLGHLESIFTTDPDLGVVTFPQRTEEYPTTLQQSDFGGPRYVGSFPNSGAAFRRELYLSLPGYPKLFFHAYEEPDFALQCHSVGRKVLFYPGRTIRHHFTSVGRDERRTHQRHARNEFWSTLMRCPLVLLPLVVPWRAVSQWGYAWKRGWPWVRTEHRWWLAALKGAPAAWRQRRPVSLGVYWSWLRLLRQPQEAPWPLGAPAKPSPTLAHHVDR